MRQIKFRAWDSGKSQMVDVRQVVIPSDMNEHGMQELVVSGLPFGANPSRFLVAPRIMQFTGLFDKNGTEIYEGDVINYGDYTDGSGPCNYVVEWGTENAAFEGRAIHEKNMVAGLDPSGEVVGNIYENPELLK